MVSSSSAFLFDLNGTMVDDMEYHFEVWYDIIVNQYGAKLSHEEVKNHLYGKSQEVLVRIFGKEKFSASELDKISIDKERAYQALYKPHVDLLPGLFSFLEQSFDAGIPMAIGTASAPFNIDFIIDPLKIRHYFSTIVTADDVRMSKPHPETFLKAAEDLSVSPADCIVFEDAPKGVEAAYNAGMKAVVLTTTHRREDFLEYDNIIMFAEDYSSLTPSMFIHVTQ
jgi:beta-phosphoglucomutase